MPSEDLFDSLSAHYDDWYKTPLGEFVDTLEQRLLWKHCGNLMGKRVLDVGCGTGIYSIRMANLGAHVSAIDASNKMITIAQEKTEQSIVPIHFIEAAAENLPFQDHSFDIVVAVSSLEFVDNTYQSFEEIHRVLKPGGKAVVGALNRESVWIQSLMHQPDFDNSIYRHADFFTYQTVKDLFHQFDDFATPNIESAVFVNYHPSLFLEPEASYVEFFRRLLKPLKGAFLVGSSRKME
ncbi:MAG: class I SAM-dependent methyltransferase [Caldisericia bacterium]|nr:class I SAM-dependent methyltransferase [Caldisericia bacterium]